MSDACINMPQFTDCCSEKYLKKLVGRTEMEDALKRLDKLTHEEARMAIAQNLKATHIVDDRVRVVIDRVATVDNRVQVVDAKAASINDQVKAINDKVAVTIDGVYLSFVCHRKLVTPMFVDGRETRVAIQQAAGDIDQVKRLWFSDIIHTRQLKLPHREPITTGPS